MDGGVLGWGRGPRTAGIAWVTEVLETPPGVVMATGSAGAAVGVPWSAVVERLAGIFGEDAEDFVKSARSLLHAEHRPTPMGL